MKLFYFYTDFFKDILQIFLDSMKDPWDIYPVSTQNFTGVEVAGGRSGDQMRKMLIDYAISKTLDNEIFIICDIDIYFYKPCINYIHNIFIEPQTIKQNSQNISMDLDIVFQKEFLYKDCNMGFMAMKNNTRVKNFWREVYDVVLERKIWDQPYMNQVLYSNIISKTDEYTEYKNLDKIIWHTFDKNIWNLTINKIQAGWATTDIKLHHANCTKYKKEKIKQMSWIKGILSQQAIEQYKQDFNLLEYSDTKILENIAIQKYLEYGNASDKNINDIYYI